MSAMETPVKTIREWADEYVAAGFALCAIKPKSKGPYAKNWGDVTLDLNTLEPSEGLGLIHGRSGTCVVDIDDLDKAEPYFAEHGINIEELLNAPDAVQIRSGRKNRAKLLYRVPLANSKLPTHKRLTEGFELRCAARNGNAMQDVLPPSIHPDTNEPYAWAGNGMFQALPELPEQLLNLWLTLGTLDNIGSTKNRIKSDLDMLDPMTPDRWADITSALGHIPADDRETWVAVGMALHPYDGGRELWEAWSSKSDKYEPTALDHIWYSFNPTAITYRSILGQATKLGWTNPKLGVSKSVQEAQRTEAEFMAELDTPSGDVGTSVDFSTAHEDDPELIFYVDKWLPQGQVTLFAGHGGGGKSFAAMTLAVHVALGIDFGDLPVRQAVTYFFSAEDNQQQIRKRVKAICKNLKYADGGQVHTAHLIGKLIVQDVTEIIPVLYKQGVTATLARVAEQVRRVRAELVIVDNASDAFDGDEIKRNEVKGFIQSLRMHLAGCGGSAEDVLARGEESYAGAVLLLTHTNKAAANGLSEEDYSGSTAWHNSARSRLSLVPDKEKTDVFYIKHMKANYSAKAETVTMQWTQGAFMPLNKESVAMSTLVKTDNMQLLVLQALRLAIASEGQISAAEGGGTMTHKTLMEYVDFPKDIKTRAYYETLKKLVETGLILKVEHRKDSKKQFFYEFPEIDNSDLL